MNTELDFINNFSNVNPQEFQKIKEELLAEFPVCDEYFEPCDCCECGTGDEKASYDPKQLTIDKNLAYLDYVLSVTNIQHKENLYAKKFYKKTDECIAQLMNKSFILIDNIYSWGIKPIRVYVYDFDEKLQEIKYVTIADYYPFGNWSHERMFAIKFFVKMIKVDDVKNMLKYPMSLFEYSIKDKQESINYQAEHLNEKKKELSDMQTEYDKFKNISTEEFIESLKNEN